MAKKSKPKPDTEPESRAKQSAPADAHDASGARRKLIAFDEESWHALDVLARDSLRSIQELADEAFDDLLKKHGRPVGLRAALKQSAKLAPSAPGSERKR